MGKPNVVIVAKLTALERYEQEGRDPRVKSLLRRSDPSVHTWKKAHENHQRTLAVVEEALDRLGASTWLVRGAGNQFDARGIDLVVSVGGDGTLLAASHNVSNTPILGVNSSPSHSVGFFCSARRGNVREHLARAFAGELNSATLARMRVEVGSRVVASRVLNEALFCHAIPAATSRYILRYGRQREEQRSSGLWVGTAAGSTGAIRSAGGVVLPLTSRALQLVVREPYAGRGEPCKLTQFIVNDRRRKVTVQNKMQDACLFLDGPFKRVAVALGERMSFSVSDEDLTVLGLDPSRQ